MHNEELYVGLNYYIKRNKIKGDILVKEKIIIDMLVSLSLFVLQRMNVNGVIKSNCYLLLLIPFFILRVYFLRKDKKD